MEAVLFCITRSSNMSCQPTEQSNIIDSWLFTELQKAESLLFKDHFSLLVKFDFSKEKCQAYM